MALIPCPECSRQISTAAAACPQCGFPVAAAPTAARPPVSSAAPVPAAPWDEETLWESRPTGLLLLGQALRTAVLLIVLVVLDWAFQEHLVSILPQPLPLSTEIRLAILLLLIAVAIARLAEALVRVKTSVWRLTDQRLVVETGILARRVDNLDIRTVDDTKLRQSIVGRLLGFGTVVVISKDPSNPVLPLPGVRQARKIQELIRATAYEASRHQLFMREA